MIRTPEYIKQMTPAEYKAYVEKGEKPKRLEHLLKRDKEGRLP